MHVLCSTWIHDVTFAEIRCNALLEITTYIRKSSSEESCLVALLPWLPFSFSFKYQNLNPMIQLYLLPSTSGGGPAPGQTSPLGRHPLGRHIPKTATEAGGTHPTGMYSCEVK